MIEAELGFEFHVLLFDRPPLMGEPHQLVERGGRRQVHEEVLDAGREAEVLFAQEPDLWRESSVAPLVRRCHPQGGESRGPLTCRLSSDHSLLENGAHLIGC